MSSRDFEQRPAWIVAPEEAGTRLDQWLTGRLRPLAEGFIGRNQVRELITQGRVEVDGRPRPKSKGQPLAAGQRVALTLPLQELLGPVASPELELDVLYEDSWLVAVNKPAGIPAHPLRIGERGTIVNALLARYPEMREVGYRLREAGLVHRLDNDTSGVMLAARDPDTFQSLRRALESHEIDKRYLALCLGQPAVGATLRARTSHDPQHPRRVRVEEVDDPESTTEVLSMRPLGDYSLIELRATRARRHQVRAHLAALGHPLVGDATYGGPTMPGLTRHFLHAASIELCHPHTGARLELRAPLPPDLKSILERPA